ncbi:hypothetical protein [Piscirickettsia litoralis]|uniref:hypothetical protein n=1 Tax=Piscirickettsia litoralis TaxID=1891921 RepID=UPI001F3CBB08|nr:hypothetical protein [Piscirickettsia litoralis]
MGDLNERLSATVEEAEHDLLGKRESELIEARDPLSRGETHLTTDHGIEFLPPDEFTYHELRNGRTKYKPARGHRPDAGVLDNIGLYDRQGLILNPKIKPTVLKVTNSSGADASDHHPVLRTFEARTPELTPQDQLIHAIAHELNHRHLAMRGYPSSAKTGILQLEERLDQLDISLPSHSRKTIKEAYQDHLLSFESMIKFNRIFRQPTADHTITKEALKNILTHEYRKMQGQSDRHFGRQTQTIKDLHKLASSAELGEQVFACDVEILLELRDERSSTLRRTGSPKAGLELFRQRHKARDNHTKTENTITCLGEAMGM